jgi:mRNA interferase MazF
MEVKIMVVKKGEIYYADLNPIVGCEQGGCRPVIIVQNDVGNLHSPTTIIVPVTCRTRKKKLPTHINVKGAGLPKKSIALLEQLRTIDKSRLQEKIGEITLKSMNKIDKGLLISLGCFENRRNIK